MRFRAIALTLAMATSRLFGQVEEAPDQVYETFLTKVATAPEKGEVDAFLNGDQRITLYRPSVQEVMGLTDDEAKLLQDAARQFAEDLGALYRTARWWRREALFQRIESGRLSRDMEARLQALRAERSRLISTAMEKLKNGFPASRYEFLETFIRSKPAPNDYFPAKVVNR